MQHLTHLRITPITETSVKRKRKFEKEKRKIESYRCKQMKTAVFLETHDAVFLETHNAVILETHEYYE